MGINGPSEIAPASARTLSPRIPGPRDPDVAGLRVAVVHERFTDWAGSEKVVEQMATLWPNATLHAAVCDRRSLPPAMAGRTIQTSALQRPYDRIQRYEYLLPAFPRAFKTMTLPSATDLVVVSHHAFANRVQVPAGTPVLSYVYSPARWMWEPSMLSAERGPWALRKGLGFWSSRQQASDRAAAERSSLLVAISSHVQARIDRWWGLDSALLHPPVDTDFYSATDVAREDFLLVAGRLVPYKKPDVAILAALSAGQQVVVAGGGRMHTELQRYAGDRVHFVGRVSDEELRDLYRRCKAFLFPGEEDFGIVTAEAQACGAPVIARNVGGSVDVVQPGSTGLLYDAEGPESAGEVAALAKAIDDFSRMEFDHHLITRSAERFSRRNFKIGLAALAADAVTRG